MRPNDQAVVLLAAMGEMGRSTAADLAEAMTFAQDYVEPWYRLPTPVSGRSVGQRLAWLWRDGLVDCDPPPRVIPMDGRRRSWWLTDAGERIR